jgi:hypothetical protein
MTPILFRIRFRSYFGTESAISLVLGLSLSLGLNLPTRCEAAKLNTYLTAKDLARPEVLNQNGRLLTLDSSRNSHSAPPSGSKPTYAAFPLYGGEHLPVGITTIAAGSQSGETKVGPLDFDSTIKANLTAALTASATGLAVVDTPKQNFLVEYLPRYAQTLAGTTTPSQTDNRVQTWLATVAPGVGNTMTAKQLIKSSSNSSADELSRLLNTGSSTLTDWTNKGITEVEKVLHINSSKATATKPSLNLEAQVIESPQPLASPIPEPSTWMVFSLLLGAAGLRQRLRHRRDTIEPRHS